MKRMVSLIAVALVMGMSGAMAQETTTEKPATDGKICKRLKETGSRVGSTRVCKSAEQWKDEESKARDSMRKMQTTRGATKGG